MLQMSLKLLKCYFLCSLNKRREMARLDDFKRDVDKECNLGCDTCITSQISNHINEIKSSKVKNIAKYLYHLYKKASM